VPGAVEIEGRSRGEHQDRGDVLGYRTAVDRQERQIGGGGAVDERSHRYLLGAAGQRWPQVGSERGRPPARLRRAVIRQRVTAGDRGTSGATGTAGRSSTRVATRRGCGGIRGSMVGLLARR